jgi:serine/threonine protein kinase
MLLDDKGRVSLCDFGLFKVRREIMRGTNAEYTFLDSQKHWTAPERFNGSEPSFSSDIYSAGMTIFEVRTASMDAVRKPTHFLRSIWAKPLFTP